MKHDEALAEFASISKKLTEMKTKLPEVSPVRGIIFELQCLVGDLERQVLITKSKEADK